MKKKIAYIAGSISIVPGGNVAQFSEAQSVLEAKGYEVYNPHELCADIPKDMPWELYMKHCLPFMLMADIVVVLNGWDESKGAGIEVELASNLYMEVVDFSTMKAIDFRLKILSVFGKTILNIRA